ncbi:MAG: hypothetical protein Q4C67_10330, partial [Deinococcus sp.]|nr:hypothetical protein [Deinococcus sp.]
MTLTLSPTATAGGGLFGSAPLPRKVKFSELRYGDVIRLKEPLRLSAKNPGYTDAPSVIEEFEFCVDVLPAPRGKKRPVTELRSRQYPQVVYDYKHSPREFELIYRLPDNVKVFACQARNFSSYIIGRQMVLRGGETWDDKALLAQDILKYAHSLPCALIRLHGYGYAEVWPIEEGVPDFEAIRDYIDDPYSMVTAVHAPGLDDRHLVYAGDNALSGHYRWVNFTAQFTLLNDPTRREISDREEQGTVFGNAVILSGFRINEAGHTVRAPIGPEKAPAPALNPPAPTQGALMTLTAPNPQVQTHSSRAALRPHSEIYQDISRVSKKLQDRDQDYFMQHIAPKFREYPSARTEAAAAQTLLDILNDHLDPQASLFADTDKLFDLPEADDSGEAQPTAASTREEEMASDADVPSTDVDSPDALLEEEREDAEPPPPLEENSTEDSAEEPQTDDDSDSDGDSDSDQQSAPGWTPTPGTSAKATGQMPELSLNDEPLTTDWKEEDLGEGW